MLARLATGIYPPKPHTRLVTPGTRGASVSLWEECITRRGFDGPYTIVYREGRPHEARSAVPSVTFPRARVVPEEADGVALLRRHYRSGEAASAGAPLAARRPLLMNDDVVLSVLRPNESDGVYFVNGDADDLYFIHEGRGTLRSLLGDVSFRAGDYVSVPRGLLHRFLLPGGDAQLWFLVECVGGVDVLAQYRNAAGQLRMDAPYSHRDFRGPSFMGPLDENIRHVVVQRGGRLHGYEWSRSPLDVVGWDGVLYPWAFSIFDFQAKVGRIHLPPTVHGTFQTHGALICSFVPRLLDYDEHAIPCPYPHSSVDVDEVLFYSRGNFTSRRGVGPASISHHPAGITHGPHPGAYEASVGAKSTDEVAVMLDCARPLARTALAAAIEDAGYHDSFVSG